MKNGIEVGHIFQLGTKYSDSMGISVPDSEGRDTKLQMGCYGIGITRVIASTVEQCHDDNGMLWPKNIAPFQVHLISIGMEKDVEVAEKAQNLYESLRSENREILFDDRDISAGKKFADSDLIGIPIRLTISKRSLENGGVEWKLRDGGDSEIISINQVAERINSYYQ